jgi:DNA-binding beta-propeller fold protein YncE
MLRTITRGVAVATAAAASLLVVTGGTWASTSRPDVHQAASAGVFQGMALKPAGTFAYFTVPTKNQVAVLNLKTGKYGKPIPVGSDPTGIDITPDGTTLYVCDTGGQTISKVVLAACPTRRSRSRS